ncbi:MAG: hypothetical protein ING06_14485 [Roseomonas sp.]|nr:hypothetical protein [Roseomonas sp.]
MDGLIDALKLNTVALRLRARRGELLAIDDLLSVIPSLPENVRIFCIDGKFSPGSVTLQAGDVSPGLSFLWTNNGLEKFGSNERLRKSIAEFQRFPGYRRIFSGTATYLYTPNDPAVTRIVKLLARGVHLIVNNSLNALNKYQEPLDILSQQLIAAEASSGGRFGLPDLVNFLKIETGLEFGLIHLAQSPVASLARTITVSTGSLSDTTLSLFADFLKIPKHSFLPERGGISNPFPAIPLPQGPGSEIIVNAGLWGKPLASFVGGHDDARILVFPITRPFGPKASHEEHMTLAAPDLLFAFMNKLDRTQISRLRACVDTFSQHRFGARRLNLLAQLQGNELNRPELNLRLKPLGASADAPAVDGDLLPMLNEVLYTTSAHSVSVRIYDPRTQALVVAASANGYSGKPDIVPVDQPIPIRNRVYDSVVVFTFMNASPSVPYVYLQRISPPIRRNVKDRAKLIYRNSIPKEYRDIGLKGPFMTRSLTRSELCFALMRGHLAFGTFNLEAPYPSAFDYDIDYLKLVKSGIEKLYDSMDQKIDGRWLIANAARSDAVHQLWQYQESGTFFSTEQNNVLRMIFPPRAEHALTGRRSMSHLKTQVLSWISGRWSGDLQNQVREMIKFDHVRDSLVENSFLEASFVIIRNVIQNAVKHGEPAEDLFFVDDRPWFGGRRVPCLRIYYRSSNTAPQSVIENLGRIPIEQPTGERVAYGMYNVGLLTRLLGGTLHVSSQPGSSRLTIEAHLPIPEQHP